MSLWGEIRRRNVHRAAVAYVALSWLIIQVIDTVLPDFGITGAVRVTTIVLGIGFIPAMILAWVFEFTPEGIKRESETDHSAPGARVQSRRVDRAIIAVLSLAVVVFAVDKFVLEPAPVSDMSIAVLAFEDISEAGDLAYFGEGIAEELLNLLAKIPELRVAGRTSAFSFRDNPATIPEIGAALGVTYIVEGSVRAAADRIRITVQLVEAASDTHLFSENYDRDFGDIFDIQDEVAEKVVDELQISLLGNVPLSKRVDSQAYALYLEARTIVNDPNSTQEDHARARSMLLRALEIDPNYGDALSLYAGNLYMFGEEGGSGEETVTRIRRMIIRALAIDPNNANALSWMAWLSLDQDNDIETAAHYRKRAHEADPTNYHVLDSSVQTLPFFGRTDLAARIGEYLIERDPLCLGCYHRLATLYAQLGDYSSAKARLRDAIALAPDFGWSKAQLGAVHLFAGEHKKALEIFSKLHAESGQCCFPGHLEALHDLGRQEEFEALLPQHIELHEEMGATLIIAQLYAWIGDKDEAFRWLDTHDRVRRWGIRSHLVRPWYRKLHDDPRWQALLEQYQMTDEILESLDLDIRLPPGVE